MISTKLLSEILDHRFKYYDITLHGTEIRYMYDYNEVGTHESSINIYEFAHKCKEWVLDKDYEYVIDHHNNRNDIRLYEHSYEVYHLYSEHRYNPKDLFIICQWILENKDD